MLVFPACLVLAVFLAAAAPEEMKVSAIFSFSFACVEGRKFFLTTPLDRSVPCGICGWWLWRV